MVMAGKYTSLNGICPYFTMFPLEFPLKILKKHAREGQSVLDPFCGRGTTGFATNLVGLQSLNVDSSPVATAITAAKLVQVTPLEILTEARTILMNTEPVEIPSGTFWNWAYHADVLIELCQLRTALLKECTTPTRKALRGIILGALHGPKRKTRPSYFSNQCPRTYAPKPVYAIKYWQRHDLQPIRVDVLDIIKRRANRYYSLSPNGNGEVRLCDSRKLDSLLPKAGNTPFSWVITSPPYYGMRTYIPDQWLRYWFIGGIDRVNYTNDYQIMHSSPDDFIADLRKVWNNAAEFCALDATMVVRFGGIADRRAKPLELAKASFKNSPWRLLTIHSAGSALKGKRQADSFLHARNQPLAEYDLWARL